MKTDIFSNYLGPKAENAELLKELLNKIVDTQSEWRKSFHPEDASLFPKNNSDNSQFIEIFEKFLAQSKNNPPYFSPRYSAQMLKDPTLSAILGYLTYMLSNPNNHAYEGGPLTTEMEMKTTSMLLTMCGYSEGWGHLTSGGSLANTEALWAIRDFYRNDDAVIFSSACHYSWKRICSILKVDNFIEASVDSKLHIDLNFVEDYAKRNKIKAVIGNLGSTGAGSIDDIVSLVQLKNKFGFHLHIDAAYGGFFRSSILDENNKRLSFNATSVNSEYTYNQLNALKDTDSITIDPHKQGLVSYGAGAVLYKNEKLKSVMLNTAPYTYHITDKPNIGMFSMEGSRPGAMAAACYLTYLTYPLNISGVGNILSYSFSAAKKFSELINTSNNFASIHSPDLDICCFFPKTSKKNVAELNTRSQKIYDKFCLQTENPSFILSKFVMPADIAKIVLPDFDNPLNESVTALRSVFMKHWNALDDHRYVILLTEKLEEVFAEEFLS